MKLSIIIPVYNEEKTIKQIIDEVLSVNLQDGILREIIVVDDGSEDLTSEILNQLDNLNLKKFTHKENQGKAAAVRTGIRHATGDVIIIQDADLEYRPYQIPLLLEPILKGKAKIVYGSRFMGNISGMSWVNRLANRISNITINILYGSQITDFYTCYKLFAREVFDRFTIDSEHFTFDSEITAKSVYNGYDIKEIPIDYVARSRHEGKKITWNTALRSYFYLLKFRFLSI